MSEYFGDLFDFIYLIFLCIVDLLHLLKIIEIYIFEGLFHLNFIGKFLLNLKDGVVQNLLHAVEAVIEDVNNGYLQLFGKSILQLMKGISNVSVDVFIDN